MFATDLSGLQQAGIVIGAVAGAGGLGLAIYAAVSTHRQRTAQAASDAAIRELRQSQTEALDRLATIEEHRRAEELMDRAAHQQAPRAADLRASLHTTKQAWSIACDFGTEAQLSLKSGWAATSMGAELIDDPLNGSLILKPDEEHLTHVRARITPADFTLSWTDQSVGRTGRPFRGLSPRD
jgi:hypothetical protein